MFKTAPLLMVIFASWGIALFEYMLQVPANRIGHGHFSAAELKAIIGTTLDDAALEALAAAASAAATPISDKRGTVAFRRDVVGVLARRAARIAYDRAKGAAK